MHTHAAALVAPRLRVATCVAVGAAVCALLLVLHALLGYRDLVAQGLRCNAVSLQRALWDPAYDDWTLMRRVPDGERRALARFAGADDARSAAAANAAAPLLLTYATRGFAAMAVHWACRARDAGQRPHVVALDGAATCAALAAGGAPWLPCFAAAPQYGVTSAFEPVHSRGYHDALTQRTRLTWLLLALGRDLVVSDSDVVFAPNASLRIADYVRADADVTTMESSALGAAGYVVRAAVDAVGLVYPNFGFVHVRASVRTLALFQLLHREQATAPLDDQYAYSLCVRAPHRGIVVAHFDRFRFQDGSYWHQQAHEPGARFRVAGDTRFAPHVAPVVVHLTSVPSAHKLELLGYWGLWRAACGNATLATPVAAPRRGGPRLFAPE